MPLQKKNKENKKKNKRKKKQIANKSFIFRAISQVGAALKIDDIPTWFPMRDEVPGDR